MSEKRMWPTQIVKYTAHATSAVATIAASDFRTGVDRLYVTDIYFGAAGTAAIDTILTVTDGASATIYKATATYEGQHIHFGTPLMLLSSSATYTFTVAGTTVHVHVIAVE